MISTAPINEPPPPFVFACVNGFVCENGSDQAAREISIATLDPTPSGRFHCETFIVKVFDSHDHLLYHFGASDQIRNIHHSHHSGFPRPVRDETEFLKYYETLDDDDLFRVATYRGDSSLAEAQLKTIAFFRTLLQEKGNPPKIEVGVMRSFEYPFFEKFFSRPLFDEFNLEFVVYDDKALSPYSVYSSRYPSDLFPPHHDESHLNFDGYPYPSKHGCTITRAWFYLQKRNDPLYRQIQKDCRSESIGTQASNPIDLDTIPVLLAIHRSTQGYRHDGWCRPWMDEKGARNEDIVQYNTYCHYTIVP